MSFEHHNGSQSSTAEVGLDGVVSYQAQLLVREGMHTLFYLVGCSLDSFSGAETALSTAFSEHVCSSASFLASFKALTCASLRSVREPGLLRFNFPCPMTRNASLFGGLG